MGAMQATLSWGVKQSFRSYVEATGGVIEAAGGAERRADGAFSFSLAPGGDLRLGEDGKPQGSGAFQGQLRFEAHGGMLSVKLADPAVQIGAAGAALTIADGGAGGRRLEIAKLDLDAITIDGGEIVIPAALSMDGSRVLGDHYPPGTALDPVRLRLA